MKRILVTGSAGAFAPSVITRFSRDPGNSLILTDCRCGAGAKIRPCDLRVKSQVEQLLADAKPDLILHLAGTLSTDFEEAMAVNVNAARFLLETVERTNTTARVLLTGSAAEYGVVRSEENPLRESRCLAPVSVYGLTKAWQTMLMSVFVERRLDVVAARIFNLDGPGLSERLFVGRVDKLIDAFKKGEIHRIKLGDMSAVRDYVAFEEAASQIEAIALHGETGNVYHVASGMPVKVRNILQERLARHGLDMSCVDESKEHSNRAGYDVPEVYADISRTRQLLSLMA